MNASTAGANGPMEGKSDDYCEKKRDREIF